MSDTPGSLVPPRDAKIEEGAHRGALFALPINIDLLARSRLESRVRVPVLARSALASGVGHGCCPDRNNDGHSERGYQSLHLLPLSASAPGGRQRTGPHRSDQAQRDQGRQDPMSH